MFWSRLELYLSSLRCTNSATFIIYRPCIIITHILTFAVCLPNLGSFNLRSSCSFQNHFSRALIHKREKIIYFLFWYQKYQIWHFNLSKQIENIRYALVQVEKLAKLWKQKKLQPIIILHSFPEAIVRLTRSQRYCLPLEQNKNLHPILSSPEFCGDSIHAKL